MINRRQGTIIVFLICALLLSGCAGDKPRIGTEKTYYGTIVDRAMSVVDERAWPKKSRSYVGIQFDNGEEELFWIATGCESEAVQGDYVQIESAIEDNTGLLIATDIIILEKKS